MFEEVKLMTVKLDSMVNKNVHPLINTNIDGVSFAEPLI